MPLPKQGNQHNHGAQLAISKGTSMSRGDYNNVVVITGAMLLHIAKLAVDVLIWLHMQLCA
jgi:hypothetical protein